MLKIDKHHVIHRLFSACSQRSIVRTFKNISFDSIRMGIPRRCERCRTHMTKELIKDWHITDVTQKFISQERIDINFKLKDCHYYLVVVKTGCFRPAIVRHRSDQRCPFCQRSNFGGYDCRDLEKYVDLLFHRLIDMPSIRLEWLYIPHASGVREGK